MSEQIPFEIITLNWVKAGDLSTLPDRPGIYQVYGDSPIYGNNTLLYIGRADSLGKRPLDHFNTPDSFIARQPNKSLRYAVLDNDDEQYINLIESTLIVMHKPSFNSSNIQDILKGKPIYIQNHGERGLLNLEVTNYYFKEQ